jgi:lactoylglutathione lyase
MEALRTHNLGVRPAFHEFWYAHRRPKIRRDLKMKFKKLTPNLVVRDVTAAMEFYRSVLGFTPAITVPDEAPYVFASLTNGAVEIFFNDQKAVAEEYPPLGTRPSGGALTLFIEVEGIEDVLAAVQKSKAKIVMPLKTQFYGMREFAFEDPEGWIVTIAEPVKK